jgi:molybdopterin converting factor small subunit
MRVVLAAQLARRVGAAAETALEVDAATLAAALDAVFARHPNLRGYVLDEHGHVRHHVAMFVDGESIADKSDLDLALRDGAEVYVLQALSGG